MRTITLAAMILLTGCTKYSDFDPDPHLVTMTASAGECNCSIQMEIQKLDRSDQSTVVGFKPKP